MKAIKRFEKGSETRTALDTEAINELVDAINAVLQITVSPEGAGEFAFEKGGSVLTLKGLAATGASLTVDIVVNGVLVVAELNGRIIS